MCICQYVYLFGRIAQPILEVLEVLFGELANPIYHRIVLRTEPVMLLLHLLVIVIKIEEASSIVLITRQLSITKEIKPLLAVVTDPVNLLTGVAVSICILNFRRVLQTVRLRDCRVHG